MTSLLFQILLLFGMLGSYSYNSYKITMQVSDSGIDDPSCVQNGKPCHTLTYALCQISQLSRELFSITDVTVNVTCNQTITNSSQYLFKPLDRLSVKVVGNYRSYIILDGSFTLESQEFRELPVHWTWIGLQFIGHPGADITAMLHSSVKFLTILDCKIMINEWVIRETHKLVIANTEFGQVNICPTLHISTVHIQGIFIFTNNTFSDCYHYNTDTPILNFKTLLYSSNLTIVNSTFTELKGRKSASNVTTGMYKKTHKYQSNILQKDSKLISVSASQISILVINNSRFIGNEQLILISVNDFNKTFISMQLHIYGTVIRNNTATSLLVEFNRNYHDYLMVVILKHLSVDGNIVTNTQWAYAVPIGASILSLSMVDQVSIEDSSFSHNQGTPLTLKPNKRKLCLSLKGEVNFTNNTGVMGGACELHNVHIMIETNAEVKVIFEENTGVYGGALYLDNTTISDSTCKLKVKFINNIATTSGNSVYFATTPKNVVSNYCPFDDVRLVDISTPAFNMVSEENTVSLIPGQNVYINVSVTDYFGSPSSCTADVYIMCDNWLFTCLHKQVRLNGPDHVVLAQTDITAYTPVDTKLSVSAPETLENTTIHIIFICRNDIQTGTVINLNISSCTLGFVYNASEGICKCVNITGNHGTVICSETLGIACITQGYWYGPFNNTNTTMYVSAPCSFPECSYSYGPCPARMLSLIGFAGDYKLLGFDADEQCSVGRGGLLCKSCAADYRYTFLSVSCVASSACQWWQPYLILVITLVFQVIIAMSLLLVVRFKIAVGSGFLYGPLLFLAIISHLPLDIDPNFFILRTFILIVTAVPLLNPEPFGLIQWCFFHPFNKIYNYSLRYLGPLTVLLVIGFTTLKARWCPRTLLKWQNSRLRALCILMLLSFWSLADITMNVTFNILTSTRLLHNDGVVSSVVALEPHMKYFSLEHIPIVILALLVLLIVIGPLLVVLLISPALSRVMNLTRIKPFLDEFQSCYRDNCRWYSTVYFIVWIGFVSMQSQSVPAIYIQTLFVILLSAHCLIRPYQSTVLNITDTLLLVDINFLLALMQSKTTLTTLVFVHMLVLGPILCIGVWFVGVSLIKCGMCRYLRHVLVRKKEQPLASREPRYKERLPSPPNVPVQEVYLYEENNEREPLIGIVDDN